MDIVKIYCDGACSNNPGIGGWGAILLWKQDIKELYGFSIHTTNNRMEITAAIEALKSIKRKVRSEIYTDSMYLKQGITSWINNWKLTGWNKGKVKNIDLWQELDSLVAEQEVLWYWIKGHSGDKYNTLADKLARKAVEEGRGRMNLKVKDDE